MPSKYYLFKLFLLFLNHFNLLISKIKFIKNYLKIIFFSSKI